MNLIAVRMPSDEGVADDDADNVGERVGIAHDRRAQWLIEVLGVRVDEAERDGFWRQERTQFQ